MFGKKHRSLLRVIEIMKLGNEVIKVPGRVISVQKPKKDPTTLPWHENF